MPSVAQQFARTLKAIGAKTVFGVPSGNMIDYIEALRKEEGIDFVLVGHETTAAFMADVCGRLTGVPGVCFGTFGPGATNLSTGVGGALLDRSPLIAFTDEMPDDLLHRTVQMNIDHQQLFKPITKWTTRLQEKNIAETILKAASVALSEIPGSVHIGIPAGIGQEQTEEYLTSKAHISILKEKVPFSNDKNSTEAFEEIFKSSNKPILAIGLGAVRAKVKNRVIRIAEKFQLPVLLTPMAKGIFPEKHPLYAGVLFHALSNEVSNTSNNADLVIGIGYDPVEINYETWMPQVPLVHFSSTNADVDKNKTKQVTNIPGDLEITLKEFERIDTPVKEWNKKTLQKRKAALFHKLVPPSDSFGPRAIVSELRKALPLDGILTVDVGAHLHLIGQQWHTPEPQKLLMTNGWSSMGFAIPAAMAAKLCHPELPVAAIMGDGGFLMMVGELATAKRLNLNIVFIVICDSNLSLIRIKQDKKEFNNKYGTSLFTKPEEATNHYFGVPVKHCRDIQEYKQALKDAFCTNAPTVLEIITDSSEYNDLVLPRLGHIK